jgi:hypothetical protein
MPVEYIEKEITSEYESEEYYQEGEDEISTEFILKYPNLNISEEDLNVYEEDLNVYEENLNISDEDLNVSDEDLNIPDDKDLNISNDENLNVYEENLNSPNDEVLYDEKHLNISNNEDLYEEEYLNILNEENLYARGQALEIFLSVTDCDSFDWFASITNESSHSNKRFLHSKLLNLASSQSFMTNLLANRSHSYPGGSLRSLQIFAFWTSWVRALYTKDQVLILSKKVLDNEL